MGLAGAAGVGRGAAASGGRAEAGLVQPALQGALAGDQGVRVVALEQDADQPGPPGGVGAAQVQEFHRQLFTSSAQSLRQEIKRITGRDVREATAEVETTTGSVVQVFTTGTMVQVFLLGPNERAEARDVIAAGERG